MGRAVRQRVCYATSPIIALIEEARYEALDADELTTRCREHCRLHITHVIEHGRCEDVTGHPVRRAPARGGVVDFNGPCAEPPTVRAARTATRTAGEQW